MTSPFPNAQTPLEDRRSYLLAHTTFQELEELEELGELEEKSAPLTQTPAWTAHAGQCGKGRVDESIAALLRGGGLSLNCDRKWTDPWTRLAFEVLQ